MKQMKLCRIIRCNRLKLNLKKYMHLICVVKMYISTISLTNNSNELTAIKETSKYSVKSSDFLTGDHEKDAEIVDDLEKGLYRKRMLSYGGLLKQKHKILNLDDAEDGNLINTSDEDKTTDEEEKAHSITAIWNFEKQNYYLKDLKR